MKIAILVFDEITALDAVGPFEVLHRVPGAQVHWVAKRTGPVLGDGGIRLYADHRLDEVGAADVLLVPGGFGARKLSSDLDVLAWLRAIDATTKLTTSVCTGSLLLAAAGLLRGRKATTHWAFYDQLAEYGALPTAERVVRDGKYATAAGVSAGIDLALTLAQELAGPELAAGIQLGIEYAPDPPMNAGRPDQVAPALRDLVHAACHGRDRELAL